MSECKDCPECGMAEIPLVAKICSACEVDERASMVIATLRAERDALKAEVERLKLAAVTEVETRSSAILEAGEVHRDRADRAEALVKDLRALVERLGAVADDSIHVSGDARCGVCGELWRLSHKADCMFGVLG